MASWPRTEPSYTVEPILATTPAISDSSTAKRMRMRLPVSRSNCPLSALRWASFNWRADSPRYRRVARFVDELFGHVDRLRAPGFDAKWKEVNLAASAPGMARFQAAREWLDFSPKQTPPGTLWP